MLKGHLCDGGGGSRRNGSSLGGLHGSSGSRSGLSSSGVGLGRLSRGLVVGAIPRDVTGLGAFVANLASRAQGTAVGRSAVTRDVALIERMSKTARFSG